MKKPIPQTPCIEHTPVSSKILIRKPGLKKNFEKALPLDAKVII